MFSNHQTMLKAVVVLVLYALCIAQEVFPCTSDNQCSSNQYCTKNSLCTQKYDNFCNSNSDCHFPKEMCAKDSSYERGVCVDNIYRTYYDSKNVEPRFMYSRDGLKGEFIEPFTMEEIAKLPKPFDLHEGHDHCGMDIDVLKEEHYKRFLIPGNATSNGCSAYSCDNPTERDKYSSAISKTYLLHWLVIVDGVFSEQAKTAIATVTGELNYYYQSTGFQFKSQLFFFNSPYSNYKMGFPTCEEKTNCIDYMSLMQHLRGSTWQSQGAFQVLTMPPQNPGLNGAAMFPWMTTHGLVFMNPRVLVAGSTTMPHEMGHAFGLRHTFAGISEITSCGDCYERTASDTAGDFCSDTVPVAKNWECSSTPPISSFPDPCWAERPSWIDSPYTNIMSYGTCRKLFTPQQIRRVRCWSTQFKYRYNQ